MSSSDVDYLHRMVRAHPLRTGLFSVGPILFGLIQMVNSYVNDGSVLFAAFFLAVMAAFAAMATRYHVVSYRVQYLDEQFGRFE